MILFTDYLYKGVGGVGQLVSNTVVELNKRGESAKVYCSKESYEYSRLQLLKADFIYIDSDVVPLDELSNYIDDSDVFFLTTISISSLFDKLRSKGNKLIFYSVHPETFFVYPKQLGYLFPMERFAKQLIRKLLKNRSLLFMDGPNIDAINKRGESIKHDDTLFVPVPVLSELNLHRSTCASDNDIVNLTYIGRGNDDWKIFPVIKMLQDLKRINTENVVLTIITDLNDRFITMISKYIPDNRIHINYINGMYGKDLEEYLYNKSSLHVSMGTSALEGAKIGIPTILIDYSTEPFPANYKYKWLFDSEDYSLANDITHQDSFSGYSLEEVLSLTSNKEKYELISNKCYEYVNNYHSMSAYLSKIENAMDKSSMTVNDYCNSYFHKVLVLKDRIKRLLPFLVNNK